MPEVTEISSALTGIATYALGGAAAVITGCIVLKTGPIAIRWLTKLAKAAMA